MVALDPNSTRTVVRADDAERDPFSSARSTGYASSSRFDTTRTVAAPAPNRDGHSFPHAVHVEIDVTPSSASVVPSWSQRSIRCSSVSDSTWIVTSWPSSHSLPSGAGRQGDSNDERQRLVSEHVDLVVRVGLDQF